MYTSYILQNETLEGVCLICGKHWKKGDPANKHCQCDEDPHKNRTQYIYDRPYGKKEYEDIVVESNNSSHEVNITAKNYLITLLKEKDENGWRLHVEQTRERKIHIDLSDGGFEFTVYDNGDVPSTKTNLRKALGNIQAGHFKGCFLAVLADRLNTSSSWTTVSWFMDHPEVEKFYSANPNLYIVRCVFDCVNDDRNRCYGKIHLEEHEPHKILGLQTKSLYRLYAEQSRIMIGGAIHLGKIQALIKKYGPQKTESIIENTIRMKGRDDGVALKRYVDCLMMGEVQFDHQRLFNYVMEDIYTYQGICKPGEGLMLLMDYVTDCIAMGIEPEKYPRSLKLVHDLTSKNRQLVINEELRAKFSERVSAQDYQRLAYQKDNYTIVTPKNPDDMTYEGRFLSHCVGNYIEKVADGTATIVFMRNIKAPDRPLITLDVREGQLYQEAGFGNREPTETEKAFIRKWAREKKIQTLD